MDTNLSFMFYLAQIPLITTWVVGLALAVVHRPKSKKKMNLLILALCLFIFNWCSRMVMNFILPRLSGYGSMSWIYMAEGLISVLVSTVAWIIILIAFFSEETKPKASPLN